MIHPAPFPPLVNSSKQKVTLANVIAVMPRLTHDVWIKLRVKITEKMFMKLAQRSSEVSWKRRLSLAAGNPHRVSASWLLDKVLEVCYLQPASLLHEMFDGTRGGRLTPCTTCWSNADCCVQTHGGKTVKHYYTTDVFLGSPVCVLIILL